MSALPTQSPDRIETTLGPLQVRAMRRDDLDTVLLIEQQVYPFPWTRGNFVDSLNAGYDAWIFERDGSIDAYAVLMWIPDEVHLLNLSVATPWQGKGLGRAMLAWLSAYAHGRGARGMLLEVRPSNRRALALYESCGFEHIGLRKRYYPSFENRREDACVMFRKFGDE